MRTVAFAVLCAVASVCNATTYYVSTTGNDSNDGLSSQSAFFTLAKAVDVATNSADAAEILIASGAYEQSAAIRVEAPLSIRGTGAAATDVVLRNTTSGQHVITLAHADAELALVTLTGGSAKEGPACLGIEAGLVRDCRVTGCSYGCNKEKPGGTVIVSGGRLMRSVVDDNTITGTGWNGVFSAGVRATAGIVENCLIKGNSARCYNDNGGKETSALSVEGSAQAINCTIVGNVATMNGSERKPMTTYAASGAKIVNCVIFGNSCEVADYTVWAGTAANYVNCVSDSAAAINATCKIADDPGFADAANGDYTPSYASPLRDAGSNADYAAADSTTDLKGDARILNDTIDVGALEYVPTVGLGVDFSYTVNRRLLPASVTFSAVAENASGTVTYRWDFDSDGNVDLETTEATITHEFSVAKVYDVSVTAISGQETASASKQGVVVPIQKDVYVALDGSGVYPYATPATAATTIASAIDAAADGCVVCVLPDTYTQTSPFTIDKAITLVSTTTNAADVILKNTVSGERVATVSHEGAELAGVTLTGGSASKLGAALTLTAGLVRDCTMTGNGIGGCRDSDGRSGMVCMSGGRLMRCRLVGNDGGISWNADCAGGVNASGGVIDTCLVATNRVSYWGGKYTTALGVNLTGDAKAINCTIVGNICKNPERMDASGNGAYPMATSASANARFVNCLIWGNVTKDGDEQRHVWNGSAASYVNCYSELTINETSPAVEDPGLVDVANGNYALAKNSPLVNKGVDYASAGGESEFDLSGVQNRIVGSRIDIGCYEAKSSALVIIVR
ncbi:MAG: PKD domain-containing protein [Kiritimatiellae bacterium]|nr:PKD domain-containing protein [Kiritimatiellia bacterium]